MLNRKTFALLIPALCACLAPRCPAAPATQPVISEFLAVNASGIKDRNGSRSPWIEIHNPTSADVDLAGFRLTDDPGKPDKWTFPAAKVRPGGFLLVFASGKPQAAGPEIHCGFKLDADTRFLALLRPDGSVAHSFGPDLPRQRPDISFGKSQNGKSTALIGDSAAVRVLIPNRNTDMTAWRDQQFDDSKWTKGKAGVGYERNPFDAVNFTELIATNVDAMVGRTASVLIRVPFKVDQPEKLTGLKLRMRYDDGFVAYLNGVEIASRAKPDELTWNATATGERPDGAAVLFEEIDVSAHANKLVNGANVLAIHGLNAEVNSTDFLIDPLLDASVRGADGGVIGFMTAPTPGASNKAAVASLGPRIDKVVATPSQPADADDVVITAKVMPDPLPLGKVTLQYRVMFGPEAVLEMLDDGAHGDGAAGDGVFGAAIPAAASAPGQMIRWMITAKDNANQATRAPRFSTPESAEFFGTVIKNPAIPADALPAFQWFTQNPGAASTREGTRASVNYLGQLYDNIRVHHRGGNTTAGYKFNFNPSDHFLWRDGQRRVSEINVNYRSHFDETMLRPTLSFETIRDCGGYYGETFPLRLDLNGRFQTMAYFNEEPDEDYLERQGLDARGSFYKIVADHGQMIDANRFERKTHKTEDNSDLQTFFNGIHQRGKAQHNYILDNVDVASILTYLAANTIINDNDDAQRNFMLYRDTFGDGRWRMLPWDKDLTFGKHFFHPEYNARDPQTHPFFPDRRHPKADGPYAWNFLIDATLEVPNVRPMYLRRLRTCMDKLLQPSTTPLASRYFEKRIDELAAQISRDPQVVQAMPGLLQGLDRIKTMYLPVRREHLYVDHSTNKNYPDFAGIPAAQPEKVKINFGEVELKPASGKVEEAFVALANPNDFAVDLSGWKVEGALNWTLPPGAVVPAGGTVYISSNVGAFLKRPAGPRGNQGLFVYAANGKRGDVSTLKLADDRGNLVASK